MKVPQLQLAKAFCSQKNSTFFRLLIAHKFQAVFFIISSALLLYLSLSFLSPSLIFVSLLKHLPFYFVSSCFLYPPVTVGLFYNLFCITFISFSLILSPSHICLSSETSPFLFCLFYNLFCITFISFSLILSLSLIFAFFIISSALLLYLSLSFLSPSLIFVSLLKHLPFYFVSSCFLYPPVTVGLFYNLFCITFISLSLIFVSLLKHLPFYFVSSCFLYPPVTVGLFYNLFCISFISLSLIFVSLLKHLPFYFVSSCFLYPPVTVGLFYNLFSFSFMSFSFFLVFPMKYCTDLHISWYFHLSFVTLTLFLPISFLSTGLVFNNLLPILSCLNTTSAVSWYFQTQLTKNY
ncbi:unnamed protein product [Acanthosepion pharaonis]|uniref:Uncharacterized protein n=1 Tax=Acanthosepion pharaonis TaxID=158019 RepID=A0A812AU04_ACAPH|nr:unnamed protein product [Sepia pharaonis]